MKPRCPSIEIALWENDLDAAWQALQQGGCNRGLQLSVAGRMEASRPADALVLYRKVIPGIIEQTNNAAYEEAITLIRKVCKLMTDLGQAGNVDDYLVEMRVQYKPKRNFIKLLDSVIPSYARK